MNKIFKHIFAAFLVSCSLAAALTACSDDFKPTYLGQVQVSQSYIGFPANGGSATISVNASANWQFDKAFRVITKNEDGTRDTTWHATPDWVTVSAESGSAGQTDITFTATAATGTRNATLVLLCDGQKQNINLVQETEKVELPMSTCAEVRAGNEGTTYRVRGVCTSIGNTTYGNWDLTDETGSVYIYGTLDAKGATKNFLSWGLEVGDIVTVEGPMKNYNGTIELVDVTVINIEKSLIKVDSLSTSTLSMKGGEVTAYVTCKGNGVSVDIPESAREWLSVVGIRTQDNTSAVSFRVAANDGGERSATVTFSTSDGKQDYTSEATITQHGSVVAATVAEFLAAEVGDTQYRVTGVITKVVNEVYGNVYIRDYSGEVYVYGIGVKGDFEDLELKEGDIVTLVGKRAVYKETPQMTGAQCEEAVFVKEISIADFLNCEDSKEIYYKVTGTIDEIANDVYGNLYLTDGTNRLYVYGCYSGYGAKGDDRKGFLATADIEVGDKLTIIGYKDTYNETIELCGGIYFSHEKPQ